MSVDVEPLEVGETDTHVARCLVTTVDATGTERQYRIGLTATNKVDGGFVQHGRRIDGDNGEENRPDGPSEAAWNASAEHFGERGFEVAFR